MRQGLKNERHYSEEFKRCICVKYKAFQAQFRDSTGEMLL